MCDVLAHEFGADVWRSNAVPLARSCRRGALDRNMRYPAWGSVERERERVEPELFTLRPVLFKLARTKSIRTN